MSKLDNILTPDHQTWRTRTHKELKEEIKSLVLEIIGDDDYLSQSSAPNTHWQVVGKNDLRAKLRQKVNKL